ncbi:MAG: glycosyltransferase family 2 protein [Planctomycetaceae bacterium]|nr:glycosyltransferase family 2 protein [Planctomycetaceae bacterium]MBV8312926.1 glycosyltransferase family 2 protein [Planctomycetaceae bacterium]
MTTQIVVVTPVKNEAAILKRFLSVTSQFADLIIVADQNSTDGSRAIYPRYPKVVMVENPSVDYDEAGRQLLLLAEVRKRVPGRRLILALDADEILAADAVTRPGWRTVLDAAPGTVICFEKPDILSPPDRCIRYTRPWPLGYVDDGAAHAPQPIHSIRIPTPSGAPRLSVDDVKVMHFALTQPDVQRAKMRLYAVIEATQGTARLHNRRTGYATNRDYASGHTVGPVCPEWIAGWERLGIDMLSFSSRHFYWQDFEVLRYFARHGTQKYWFDDIWDCDWEECREYGRQKGLEGLPTAPIRHPPPGVSMLTRTFDGAVAVARRIKQWLGR